MNELKELARFVAATSYDEIPAEVVGRTKLVVRDMIGVIIAGMQESDVRALAQYAAENFPGDATLFGYTGTVTPEWAVLVHGTAGTSLEMDEGHAFARGHAAIHAIPTSLALGQSMHKNGKEMLLAMIMGYEVAARAGVGSHLRKSVHPFGAWGVLGAAAVSARMNGLEPKAIEEVLELAGSYAITPSFETAYQGANVRNTYAGIVNKMGFLAVEMYKLGFRGEQDGLQTSFGKILGDSFNASALNDRLGDRFEIMRGYFKPYSGCRYTHAAIDAVLGLHDQGKVHIDEIEQVEVATYDIAAHLTDPKPKTALAGRFSTPYVVAATLIHGSAGPEIFSPEVLTNPSVLDLSSRVKVTEDLQFTALTPKQRPAKVSLLYRDGTFVEHQVMGSKGDPDQPMSLDELKTKFYALADSSLGSKQAAGLWSRLNDFEEITDFSVLAKMLGPIEA